VIAGTEGRRVICDLGIRRAHRYRNHRGDQCNLEWGCSTVHCQSEPRCAKCAGTGSNYQLADVWSRPHTLALAVAFYAVGYAMCAGARNVSTVVAGQLIYTVGNSGITFRKTVLKPRADIK
jgi:hypothetical protein